MAPRTPFRVTLQGCGAWRGTQTMKWPGAQGAWEEAEHPQGEGQRLASRRRGWWPETPGSPTAPFAALQPGHGASLLVPAEHATPRVHTQEGGQTKSNRTTQSDGAAHSGSRRDGGRNSDQAFRDKTVAQSPETNLVQSPCFLLSHTQHSLVAFQQCYREPKA